MKQRATSTKYKRKRKLTELFFRVFILGSLFSILAIVFLIVRTLVTYQHSRDAYQSVAKQAISTASSDTQAQPTPEPTESKSHFVCEYLTVSNEKIESESIKTTPITIDWANLHATNKQIVAWLYCEGTGINYPVMQCKENTYYLTHNVNKKLDQAGGLFLDYRNELGRTLQNLIIYGHRMKDGSMFGDLAKFAEKTYCDKHGEFYLMTPGQNYKIDLFACRTVHGETKYFPTSFADTDAENTYIAKARSQSYWQELDQGKEGGAVLLTLATCSKYDFSNSPRLTVHGWAIPVD